MDLTTFCELSSEQVADLVRGHGSRVCAFPINGTRRWYTLEHAGETATGSPEDYLRITWARHVYLYRLLFDHGIDTLLTPIFGPDLLQRGAAYQKLIEPGLLWFTQDAEMLAFYDQYDVRVRVYGDAERHMRGTPYAHLLDAFASLAEHTAQNHSRRLFFGVCAHDATETVAEIGARFHQEHGRLPKRRQIVEAYYGEYVEPVDLFIGFDRFSAFDMPLLATGGEDLYFTVAPSPYMDAETLRSILYDHLYARRVGEDYAHMSSDDWTALGEFYKLNRRSVLGVGREHESGQFWYPTPQVELPQQMTPYSNVDETHR